MQTITLVFLEKGEVGVDGKLQKITNQNWQKELEKNMISPLRQSFPQVFHGKKAPS